MRAWSTWFGRVLGWLFQQPWNDYVPLLLVVMVGAIATSAIYLEVTRLELTRVETAFYSAARDRELVIRREIDYSLNVARDIQSFFSASDRVSRREFREFVQPALKRDPSIASLSWVPKVDAAEREEFLADARRSFPQFEIHADALNSTASDPEQTSYPLLYAHPYRPDVTPLGLDLGGLPAERELLARATETGRIQVRAGPSQIPSHDGEMELAAYLPVHWLPPQDESEPATPIPLEHRPEALRGFVIGRFIIEKLVERALANLSPSGIDIAVLSTTEHGLRELLYYHASRASDQDAANDSDPDENNRWEHRDELKIADSQWTIVCTSVSGKFVPNTLGGRVVLASGGGFTLLFAAYLFTLLGRAKQVQLLVSERTLQLEAANKALNRQMDERIRAERALQRFNLTLEARVAQRTAEAERRAAELEQFAYVASHDLKAPLRAIANLAEWLEDDLAGKLTPDTSEQLRLLRDRVTRMHLLIEGLLSYSRVGRTEAAVSEVDCGELVAETVDSLSPPPGFRIEVVSPMPKLTTDRLQLGQVFANLIGNSVKHHHRDRGLIRVSGQDRGRYCEFSVADDGPGIPAQYQDKVFKMFQTLHTKDFASDTGIGLALAKKIVEEHGGTIDLTSEEGAGSTFRFTWNKEKAPEMPDRAQGVGTEPPILPDSH